MFSGVSKRGWCWWLLGVTFTLPRSVGWSFFRVTPPGTVTNADSLLITKWAPALGIDPASIIVRRMKTKWGSCDPHSGNVHLNTELAEKPRECLEYVLVHEMVHLLEPSHNANFVSLMDKFMLQWRHIRDELNRAPLGHVEWEY